MTADEFANRMQAIRDMQDDVIDLNDRIKDARNRLAADLGSVQHNGGIHFHGKLWLYDNEWYAGAIDVIRAASRKFAKESGE